MGKLYVNFPEQSIIKYMNDFLRVLQTKYLIMQNLFLKQIY